MEDKSCFIFCDKYKLTQWWAVGRPSEWLETVHKEWFRLKLASTNGPASRWRGIFSVVGVSGKNTAASIATLTYFWETKSKSWLSNYIVCNVRDICYKWYKKPSESIQYIGNLTVTIGEVGGDNGGKGF